MTSRVYNQRVTKERIAVYDRVYALYSLTNQVNPPRETAKRASAGGFSLRVSSRAHILTDKIDDYQRLSDFLDNTFKEWESWVNDRELRLSQLAFKYRQPFAPLCLIAGEADLSEARTPSAENVTT